MHTQRTTETAPAPSPQGEPEITVFASVTTTVGQRMRPENGFDDLEAMMRAFSVSATKGGGGFACGTFRGNRRGLESQIHVTAAAFDVEGTGNDAVLETERRLHTAGVRYVLTSTFNHTPEAPRFRLVMPLSRPATPPEWTRLWPVLVERFAIAADPNAKDPSRFWFRSIVRPSCTPVARSAPGLALGVDELLKLAAPTPKRPVTTGADWLDLVGSLGEGNRDAGLTKIAGAYFRALPARLAEVSLHAVNRSFCRPPLSDDQVIKIASSIARREGAR